MTTLHDFTVTTIDGKSESLADLSGKVLLVVNVASRCGLTPQYAALEELHRKYAGKGFSVLAFPCNDFAGQEPGSEADIATFCKSTYDVTFPMFSKVRVLGDDRAPVYAFLVNEDAPPKGKGDVVWNFEKFLVDREGRVVGRWNPTVAPLDPELTTAIEGALG
jgi:glutathione peroxidase